VSGPLALPLLLDGFGMPGCALLADPAALAGFAASNAARACVGR
jgi:hypothetical protein